MTSLYDLEVAICESEGIERFEELELGPLVRHPLAMLYFHATPDLTEVHRITTEEIICYLCEFLHAKKKEFEVDVFLDFISKKRSVCGREKLGVRIQNMRDYINHLEQVRQSEDRILEKGYEKMRMKSVIKKRPPFSAQKKELDDNFSTLSQRVKSFSSASTQFCGTHIRFMSSSSEDDESEATEYEDNPHANNTDRNCSSSLPNHKSNHISSCPYPSATEEIARLGLKIEVVSSTSMPSADSDTDNELLQRKRRFDSMSPGTSLPCKLPKRDKYDVNLKHEAGEGGYSLSTESLRMFITTWKETCCENNVDEVLERMLQFYNTRKKRHMKKMLTSYPFVGLLNAAVTYIKHGIWDNMHDTFQNFSETGMDDKPSDGSADYLSVDVKPAQKDVAILASEILTHKYDVTAEDITNKIHRYFEDDIVNYKSSERDEGEQQALHTGRLGELVALKYFMGKVGHDFVKWVNETNETGLPFDIVVGGSDENSREYVEVKATKYGKKNWFLISMREWQFALEKGESFSIAHVDLADENMARVTIYKNPARLCQLGNLKLAIMVPK